MKEETIRLWSLLLCAVLIVAMAVGCGQQDTADDTAETEETVVEETAEEAEDTAAETEDTAEEAETSELTGTVSTNGSTSMEKVIAGLIESFTAENPGVTVTYDATGSGTGITAASEGGCDIGLSSRNLKDDETGLTATVIALDGIAIVVNPANTVTGLTTEQIAALFTGEITNWSEVGGEDNPVAIIGREAGSGTRDGFESIVGVEDACAYEQELTSTGAVMAAVASNEYAIGYVSLASLDDSVVALTVDGVECTEATVLDGSYVIQRPFVMVTKEGETLSEAAQAFLDYATSPEAADVISAAGAVQAQ